MCMDQEMAITNDSVLKQLIEAENSHDLEKMLALTTDDVIVEDVSFGMIRKGKDCVNQGFASLYNAIPNFKVEPKSWVINDRSFAVKAIFA
jgi:ketosteroid isomerase-like protein